MVTIEQTLVLKERELEEYLSRLDDPHLRQLLSELTVLRSASEIVARMSQGTPMQVVNETVSRNGSQNGHQSLIGSRSQGDATEEILRKAGGAVSIDGILKELSQRGIKAKKDSFIATLRKDRRKRFSVIGGNALLRGESGTSSSTNGSGKSLASMGFSLMGSIKELLPQLRGEFSQPIIYKMLLEKYPHMAKHIQKASVATTLRKLSDDGVIEITHQGFGSDPRRYKNKGS
jgi:hypothetical protein